MSPTQNICRNNKFGYCKFGEKCKFHHIDELCENKFCEVSSCENRHPKPCLYQRKYGQCKFSSYCRYSHEVNDDLTFLKKQMELFQTSNELLKQRIENLEEKVKILEDPNKTVEIKGHENISPLDKGNIIDPEPDIPEALVCKNCDVTFENKDDLKSHFDAHHDKIVQLFNCDQCAFNSDNNPAIILHKESFHGQVHGGGN